jgi:hypothetical protein
MAVVSIGGAGRQMAKNWAALVCFVSFRVLLN